MGSDRRLRATMMTDMVDALGLLPAALSTRIGAQTQRPLAIVVIGGALAILLLTRILQPVLIYLCHRRLRLAEHAAPPAARERRASREPRRGCSLAAPRAVLNGQWRISRCSLKPWPTVTALSRGRASTNATGSTSATCPMAACTGEVPTAESKLSSRAGAASAASRSTWPAESYAAAAA